MLFSEGFFYRFDGSFIDLDFIAVKRYLVLSVVEELIHILFAYRIPAILELPL